MASYTIQDFEKWKNGTQSGGNAQVSANASTSGTSMQAPSSGYSVGAFEEWRKNRTSGTTPGGNSAVSDWVSRYNRVMKGVSDYDKKRNGGYTKDASGGFGSEIASLIADYDGIKDYGDEYGFRDGQRYLANLKKLQNSIGEMDDIFAQFEDEEDYNRYLEDQKDREEKRKVDLKVYGQEIADMEQELDRWMDPDSDIGSMTWAEYDAKIEEMQKDLDQKKLYYSQAKRIQDEDASAEKYGKVSKNLDFASKSGYDPSNQEIGYQYVNAGADGQKELEQKYGRYATQFADMGIDSMNDEERAVYNYYMNSGDREEAAAYLRWLEETLQIRKGEQTDAALDRISEDSPGGAKALRYAFMANLGYDQHLSGMRGMGNMIAGKDDYVPVTATQVAGDRVREDLGQYGLQLPEWMGGGSTGQMVGDLISTTANMAPSMIVGATIGQVIPGAGAAVMGASAGGSAYQEKINEGYSKEQARKYGIAVGASETALSAALSGIKSLGGGLTNFVIEDALQGVKSGLGRFIIEYGGSIASEALEEGIQEILTPIFSNRILGTDEKVDWGQVVYSALLGGLSAGILEGPSAVVSARKGAAETRNATAAPNNATIEKSSAVDDKMSATEAVAKNATTTAGVPKMEAVQMTGDIDSFAQQYGKQAAAVKQNYLEGQDLQEYEVGFQAAFAIGKEGGKKEVLQKVPYLSQSQKDIAYSMGRDAAAKEAAAPKQTGIAAKRVTDQGTQDVTIAEVTGMDNDTMTFRLEDGSTVTDEELNFDNGQEVLSAVWELGMNTEQANAVVTGMASNEATDVAQAAGLQEAYRYGTRGYTMEQLTQRGKDAAVLTDGQRKAAWEAGRQIWMQKAETPTNKIKPAGKSGVWFDNGGGDVIAYDQFDTSGLKDTAKAGVQAAQVLQKLGIGRNYYFYESQVNEAGERVYKDENGEWQKAPNGWYDPSDGSIHIDLNAGSDANGVTLYTLSHELVHMVEDQNKKAYRRLADFLVENYAKGEDVDALVFKKQAELSGGRGEAVSYEEAYSEFIADSMEAMLADGNVLEKLQDLKKNDRDLFDRIKAFFEKVLKDIRKFYQNLKPDSDEGKMVLQMKDQIEQIQQLFAEALAETGKMQAAEEIGLEVDTETESVAPAVMYSERTWKESDYVQERNKAAQEIAQAIGVTEKKARDYIDSINSIAKMIAEDRTRLDYFSSPYRSSFVSNVEYGGSFDFSTLCKKRRLLTGTFTAIQKALPNTALTADEILDIRNRMKDAGLEVSCGLCYVEGSRANMGQFAKEFLRLYKQYYPDAWQPNMADVNTPDGIEWVRINHPECYEQYEYFWNHYGTLKPGDKNLFASQQKPKLYQLHTEYQGEILQKFKNDDNVEEKNRNGGIRLQSFSDFEIVHLIDTMQIIMDMSRVGLAGQAYTKVPDFAWALGDTGLKINLSLIAKGVDESGKLIFDDIEGMPIAEAMKLRDRYSANVGTILVAFNDAQLMAAMADDRVDFIIPFHRSQWKKSQYEAMGLPAKTKDYTYMQNEKFIKPQYHEYRGRMVKDKATNYMPNEYWDFSKTGKENAEAYLQMCARNNKRPKFYKLLQNNGDGNYSLKADGSTDGYWKLLIDFKMYDNDGNGSPQMAVRPEFNMAEATRMLTEYQGGHSNFPVAQGIVDEFVGEYKEKHGKRMYSDRKKASGYDYSKPFSQQVDDWISGNFPAQDTLLVGGTPSVLTGIGFPSLPITITQTNLKANINGEYRGTQEEILDHIISSADFKRLPELIADPVAIIADRRLQRNQWTVSEHVVDVMVEMEINGKQSLVPIKIDGKGMQHGATIDALSISSVHGNRDAYDRLEYALAHDSDNQILTFYVNKNKATAVLRKAGHTITGWPNSSNGFIHSITEPNSPVKLRITHQTETRQFKKWFKGSKVVNPDGSPKEMYHGSSNSGFTVFNTYGGNFGLFGKGSYFTDNPEVADSYTRKGKGQNPGVYGVYLSIKNPLDMDANADLNAWKKAFEDADLDSSYLDGVVTNEDAFRQLKENLADEEYLRWEAEDIVTELIEGMGYDGITHIGGGRYGSKDGPKHRVYIAFEPEQIKSSTDNIGTFDGSNPDIRYQDRATGTSNRDLLAGAFEDLARSPAEMEFLQKYQENIGLLNEQEAKLQEIRTEIRELTFGKGPKDPKRLAHLQNEATKTANRINIYDKKLLQLETAKPLRDVLDREREKVRKATRQKGQEAMAEYREKRKESAARKDAKRKIRKTVMELDKLLNRGDKKKNVKSGMTSMVDSVLKLADALFMDEYTNRDMLRNGVGVELTDAEEKLFRDAQQILQQAESGAAIEGMEFTSEVDAMEQLKKLDQKLSSKMAGLKDVFARERKRLYGTTVSDLLGKLADEYSRLSEAEDGAVRAAKDENVYAHLLQLQKDVGGTTVRDMTLTQMEAVADAFTMVLTTVRNANKMFAKNLKFKRDTLAGMVMGEIGAAVKKVSKLIRPVKNAIDSFSWNNLKPVYAFERLGSETLKTLYQNIRSGQDVWSRDMQEADDFRREQYRKHNRKAWDLEKQHRFEFESGIVELNLEQIMSLYAYSRREQALDHLLKGGFVFSGSTEVMVKEHGIQRRYLKKDATAYNLTADELLQVVDTLTKEQKAFVEEMQTYLSDVMGGKGNEISLQMYGIKSYGEKNYFPIRSAGQYMERAKEDSFRKEQGQISIVNSGFTKSTTPKANNPITLDGFMNVWADHVNEMSMYHGFALPMEDFRRVYNYSSPNMEVGNSQSVNAAIENAFGKAAINYIDQLYKDLNGGALTDNRENLSKKLVGLHKKAAVFASASVVVQQPTAIVRAFALIDPRHFIGPKVDRKRHKQLWEEVKKYAPVAFVKEMGYFDTGMGRSARDFLQAEEYSGIREKMAALFKDADYRDEILGKAPALADELTWCSIWEAVKRETKAKNPSMDVRSDSFLQIAGARFSEVIDKTQVYDSVLSRSANMRSKALHMNMLTSFLAEPTTSINMLEDALRKGDRQQLKRTVGAVYGSVLLNSLLVSLVYAARDDDEDETWWEKYLSSVAVEMMDGINPITYYPFLRDIWSIGQGFDVERADMSLISDFADAAKKVVGGIQAVTSAEEGEEESAMAQLKDSLWGMVDTIANLTGLPVKNIRRDIEAARNVVSTISTDRAGRMTTKLSLKDAVLAEVMNSIPIGGLFYEKNKRDRLYGAIVAKDKSYEDRLKAGYETYESYHSAIRLALRDHDSRIWEAAVAWKNNDLKGYMALAREIIAEGNFIQDDVVLAIRAEASSMEDSQSASSSTVKGYFTNEKFGVAMGQNNTVMADAIRKDLIDTKVANGKTRSEAEEAVESTARSQLKELYELGEISGTVAQAMLVRYGGYDQQKASDKVSEWKYGKDNPELDGRITYTQYKRWEADGKSRGVPLETYTKVAEYRGGDTSAGTRSQEDVAAYINSMPISTAQKDALWCCFWSEKTLYKNAPWH